MILWTLQPVEVFDFIQEHGYYICDPSKSSLIQEFAFGPSYDWLNKKMVEKIGNKPEGVVYPVWAWHTYNWKRKKPDLRCSHGKKGEPMVCMEIEIPDEQVVLSDFDAWHYVLNGWHHNYAQDEEEWDRIEDMVDALPPEEKQKEIERSWDNIFNIEPINSKWVVQGAYIQATFWKLDKNQIKKVQFFKSR